MHRLIVALLAAFDAVVAAAVGIAAALAPLTLLWVFGFGDAAPWGALWPASASVWQLGNLVPLHITLPPEYLAATGIAEDAASFVVSLAPLAFAGFTAIFAARSGARASRADAWVTGVVVGSLVFAAATAAIAVTSRSGLAAVHLWEAVLLPALVFAVPAALGAVVTEWVEAGAGIVARLRDRVEAGPHGWGGVAGLVARGSAVVVAGLAGAGALAVAVALLLRGGEIVALFEAGNLDLVGIVVVGLGQLAYVPTLVVFGMSFLAGPGFAVGAGTAVSPAGTQLGVVPGIPVLGALPESTSPWTLMLVLVPVALGALAGWIARSRFVSARPPADASAPSTEPIAPRLAIGAGIAVVAAAAVALLAATASGSMGPGRLAVSGPEPGPVALAVGLEVLLGASILLLSPRPARRPSHEESFASAPAPAVREPAAPAVQEPASSAVPAAFAAPAVEPDAVTAPIELPGTAEAQEPPVD